MQEIAGQLNISKRTIRRDIEKLKQQNKLKRIGTEKTGHWEIINWRLIDITAGNFSTYKALNSARHENLPVAIRIAEQVICLPIYPDLKIEKIKGIIEYIKYA